MSYEKIHNFFYWVVFFGVEMSAKFSQLSCGRGGFLTFSGYHLGEKWEAILEGVLCHV